MNWFKKAQRNNFHEKIGNTGIIRLYRGINHKFDENFDLAKSDAPIGYSTWTDNPHLARAYAGENGFVYKIDLPKDKLGESYIDEDGERPLFFNNGKAAGLNNITGNEYLVYHYHDYYGSHLISELKSSELH